MYLELILAAFTDNILYKYYLCPLFFSARWKKLPSLCDHDCKTKREVRKRTECVVNGKETPVSVK